MIEEAQAIETEEELPVVNTIEVPIPDVEVDVIDDRPLEDQKPPRQGKAEDDVDEEIEGIGERTKKRIDKLKYDYHEEKRRADAAQRVRDESVGLTRQLHEENQKLKATVAKSEDALINSLKNKTSTEIDSARSEYKTAYESGDTERLLNAQEKLSAALADKTYVDNYVPTMPYPNGQPTQQAQQYQQPQYQQPVYQQPAPDQAIDPAAAEYIRKNPWFERAGDEDMTALAYGMHAKLVREGIDPIRDSEIYYTKVDAAMKERFPERFEESTASSQRPSTVVAPANRTGTKQRRVQLTKTQVDLARRLGLTPEQYASQYAKELNNG
tara:strand:+ start:3851 stop:4828 length:978 start_codon:yes stop_codon:yes gene_type:complete